MKFWPKSRRPDFDPERPRTRSNAEFDRSISTRHLGNFLCLSSGHTPSTNPSTHIDPPITTAENSGRNPRSRFSGFEPEPKKGVHVEVPVNFTIPGNNNPAVNRSNRYVLGGFSYGSANKQIATIKRLGIIPSWLLSSCLISALSRSVRFRTSGRTTEVTAR